MWVPDWLYERLPVLYLAASGGCAALLQTSFATLSAVLLFAAASLTHHQRRNARRVAPAHRTDRARRASKRR